MDQFSKKCDEMGVNLNTPGLRELCEQPFGGDPIVRTSPPRCDRCFEVLGSCDHRGEP